MKNEKALTLLELIVIILIVLMLLAIFIPSQSQIKKIAPRIVCGTNLKGLGTAMVVYANDNADAYPQLPGKGPWARELGFDYNSFSGPQAEAGRTISASWYLLVREADVSPKSFVCPSSSQAAFDGGNPSNLDITELWDFGGNPYKHVSYSMHNPYGKFPADGTKSAAFALAGDMSPWFKAGDIVAPGEDGSAPQIIKAGDDETWSLGNSCNHPELRKRLFRHVPVKGSRPAENVLFGDGHNSFEKSANCGVGKDNIYTFWSKDDEPSEQDRQGGTNPTARDEANDARSEEDSFLGI